MAQLALDLAPQRRIDITLGRLDDDLQAMSAELREKLAERQWWNVVVIVSRLRSMELAEEGVLPGPRSTMADAYDRVAVPGEHAVAAILRTFRAVHDPADYIKSPSRR